MSNASLTHFQVHTQQQEAGDEILSHYRGAVHRYVLLLAPCQSGKTGTFHHVARKALQSGLVDRVYLLCGSSETILRNQAEDDAAYYNGDYFEDGRFQVIFHSKFKATTINPRRSLIILDESHMDQGKDQLLIKFAHANGFDFWGTTDSMRDSETYILSVSATPYSELSDIYHKVTPFKAVVELQPGPGYIGVDHYLYTNRIHSAFDLSKKWSKFARRIRAKGNRYNLIRTYGESDTGAYKTILTRAESEGFKVLHYTMDKAEIAITRKEQTDMIRATLAPSQKNNLVRIEALRATVPCLEDEPSQPILVLLKGKLRAGKVVPKKFIGLVWEDSKNPNTDTVIQSLLGRMCGYVFGDELPDIYISGELLAEAKTIIKMNGIARHVLMPYVMPMRGTNVRAGHGSSPKESETGRYPCVPLLWEPECAEHFESRSTMRDTMWKELLLSELQDSMDLMRTHDGLTEEQKNELNIKIPSLTTQDVAIRNFSGGAHYENIKAALDTKTCPTLHLDPEDPPVIFCILWGSLPDAGKVIVVFHTESRGLGFMNRQNLKTRIPFTTGQEMFRCRLTPETVLQSSAGLCLGMPNSATRNPAVLAQNLRSILAFEQQQTTLGEDGIIVNPIVKPMKGAYLPLSKEHYSFVSPQMNSLCDLIQTLQTEYNITITLKMVESETSLLVRQISWSH